MKEPVLSATNEKEGMDAKGGRRKYLIQALFMGGEGGEVTGGKVKGGNGRKVTNDDGR